MLSLHVTCMNTLKTTHSTSPSTSPHAVWHRDTAALLSKSETPLLVLLLFCCLDHKSQLSSVCAPSWASLLPILCPHPQPGTARTWEEESPAVGGLSTAAKEEHTAIPPARASQHSSSPGGSSTGWSSQALLHSAPLWRCRGQKGFRWGEPEGLSHMGGDFILETFASLIFS